MKLPQVTTLSIENDVLLGIENNFLDASEEIQLGRL
jgi:hypothetical protein